MNIAIIGGTGKTGLELIKQGLEQGHCITAVVRNPKKIKFDHPNLTLVKGDVLIPESFEYTFREQDAVLSALGHKRFFIKTTILSRGTKNIVTAIITYGVRRLLCITSLGINDSRFKLGLYYTLFTIPIILFFYFLDKSNQEEIIMNSTLDWTIVRPAQLTNGKKRGTYKLGSNVGSYILTKMISRADVAHFMLNELVTRDYVRQAVGITY